MFFIVWSISPEKNEIIAAIAPKPHTISVGNLATSPVAKYSLSTGINIIPDISARMSVIIPKNENGL